MSTERKIDVAVWTAEQIMEQYSDPYDAIEWLVMNLKDEAFKECADYYDERMNELINQIELPEFTPSKIIITKNK